MTVSQIPDLEKRPGINELELEKNKNITQEQRDEIYQNGTQVLNNLPSNLSSSETKSSDISEKGEKGENGEKNESSGGHITLNPLSKSKSRNEKEIEKEKEYLNNKTVHDIGRNHKVHEDKSISKDKKLVSKEEVREYNKEQQLNNQNPLVASKNQPRNPDSEDLKNQPQKVRIRDRTTFSWQNVGSWDAGSEGNVDKKALLKNAKIVESYIIDHFYGDWFWNCSLILGTCFFAWLVARLGGSILSLGFVLLFTNSVYRSEFRRFNRNIRDDLTRVKANNRLVDELETMEWMNSFLDKFWVIYMPALSETVMFQTNEILKDQAPGMGIEALSLNEFTLGSKAPRVDSIKSYTQKGKNIIEMDWAFSFAPNDTDDMTKNEIKKKIDPKVALGVTVGKGIITKSLPILVEDMTFIGRMKVKLRLNNNFPHVKMVSIQFLEAPTIDYALKPVGGDTLGLDIMSFIPGLSKFINGIIHSTLRPMLYAPNSLDVDVEELMSGQSNDSIGVVAVTVKQAKKLKTGSNTKPNSINPYVQIQVSNNGEIDERTNTKKSINDPIFMETKYILINQLEGNFLNFNVFDLVKDKPDDKLIGNCEFPLSELLQEENIQDITKNIMEGGKVVGKLNLDIKWFPTIKPITLEDGSKEIVTDAEVGIMKITLHEAKDLDISQSVIGLLNPYAEIFVNNELVKKCRRNRQTNEPSWEQSFESIITNQSETTIQILVRDSVENNIVGNLQVNLQDIVFESGRGQEWFECPPIGPKGPAPKIRISASWKPLALDEDTSAKVITPAPIGGMRLHLRGAKNLKNLESVGYVDPYVKVILNGKLRAKTVTFEETINPQWNSVYFLPVTNEHQHYLLEIMDAEPEGKDRSLGTAAINIADFIRKNDEGYFLGYDGGNEVIEQAVLFNSEPTGSIYYSVSFFPTIPTYSLSQLHNEQAYQKQLEEKQKQEEEQYQRDKKLYRDNPEEFQWVEIQEDNSKEPPKIEVKLEDAIKYRAGAMTCHLFEGHFERNEVYVQILFDEQVHPSGITSKIETKSLSTKTNAECFIRDLPNSIIVFRVTKTADVTNEKDIVAEKIFSTIDIYEKSYKNAIKLNLGGKNSVEVQLEFTPSIAKLAPLDTILDVGKVKLEIIGAESLKSVDSNGKSDPICVVKLDGVEIFRTQKRRKTLDPLWNEAVEFPMISRSRQLLLLEVYDWDLTHDDELLGIANLDISEIPALTTTPFTVNLNTQGKLNLRATFFPEYIRPPLNPNSLLPIDLNMVTDAPMKMVGSVGEIAHNAVGTGIGTVSDSLTKGHGFLSSFKSKRKRGKDKHNNNNNDAASEFSPIKSQYSNDTDNEHKDNQEKHEESKEEEQQDGDDIPEEEKEFRKTQDAEIASINALPNVREKGLPAPQMPTLKPPGVIGHSRNTSTATDATSFSTGPDSVPGRLTIIEAKNFQPSKNLEVKVTLRSSTKDKSLIKTRPTKFDKHYQSYRWSESVPFRSSQTGQLIINLREHHTFGKSVSLGEQVLNLADYINVSENIPINVGEGILIINLKEFRT
ncbi:unnamed protein product [Candida verbasci]|uniref:Tricalbin-3 n=1 Tax=Candida verbasci TaxID=1227364 RepID=A0A9W4XHA4_9ASCO|nr:unnamed protein product [Candida verbasci]